MRLRDMGLGGVLLATMVALGTLWTSASQAQAPAQQPPQRIQVTTVELQPDTVGLWEDVVRNELIPALKKAGVPWRHTWAVGVFGEQFVRVAVTPVTNYAQYDQQGPVARALGPAGAATYAAKVNRMVRSVETRIMTLQENNSIMSGATTMQPLMLIQTFLVQPGRGGDFGASLREDYLPAYRKAGIRDYWVHNTNFGGPAGEITVAVPIAKYAELDLQLPLGRAGLSQEQINKINARRNALLRSNTTPTVYRFIPELSYGMPAMTRSTN